MFVWLLVPGVVHAATDLRDGACVALGRATASASPTVDPGALDYRCDTMPTAQPGWLWLRASPAAVAQLPAGFEMVIGRVRLARLDLVVVRADGRTERQSIDPRRMSRGQAALGGVFHFTVAPASQRVTQVYFGFNGVLDGVSIRQVEAMSPAEFNRANTNWLLLLGLFFGGVGTSLIGALFFYRAIRLNAHLWYAAWSVTILSFGVVQSNLVYWLLPGIDGNDVVRLTLFLIAAATSLGSLFFASYIEPGVLPRAYRRIVVVAAVAGVITGVAAALDRWLHSPAIVMAFTALLLIQLVVVLAGIIIAHRRSSRTVKFYVIAWVMPLATFLASIAAYQIGYDRSGTIDIFNYLALTAQAILLFVGHADRFAVLQREHRDAVGEQQILRRLAEVVFQLSNDGEWTFLNPAWEELSGRTVEQTLGKSFAGYLHPDDRAAVATGTSALRRGEIAEYRDRVRYAGADGDVRWVSLRVHVRHDDNGAVVGTGGSFHDITERHLSQAALAASEERYRALTEISIAGIYECDADWNLVYTNPAFRRISGLTATHAVGDHWLEALRPDFRAVIAAERAKLGSATATQTHTLCFVHPDGTERWASSGLTPIHDSDGCVSGYAGVTLDITDEHLAREALAASEARFKALARLSPAVIFRTDPRGCCTFINAAWTTLTGRTADEAIGFGYIRAVDPGQDSRIKRNWRAMADAEASEPFEYRFRHLDGSQRWTTIETAREIDADGNLTGFVGVITDITAQKALEHELESARAAAEHAATTDELTGLANRRRFMAQLGDKVAARRAVAVAVIDVDHFKQINDTLGHPFGDDVLREVARILRAGTRPGDLVGRVGGEEFALMLPDTDLADAQAICERLREAIAAHRCDQPGRSEVMVTVSAGVALLQPGESVSGLISRADQALYRSKDRGRNQVQLAA